MNGWTRAAGITAIAIASLAACGDDAKSPAPAGTTPAPTGTEAMMSDTTDAMMSDTTDAMMSDTTDAMMSDATSGG